MLEGRERTSLVDRRKPRVAGFSRRGRGMFALQPIGVRNQPAALQYAKPIGCGFGSSKTTAFMSGPSCL